MIFVFNLSVQILLDCNGLICYIHSLCCCKVHNHIERRTRQFICIIVCFIFQLAPSLPLQEDFVYHWKAITHYYIETSGKRSPAVIVNVLYYQITTHHLLFMFCR